MRAWAAGGDHDTNLFEQLVITIEDVCQGTDLTIDDSVFKTVPEITLTQFLNYDDLQISWTDSIVSASRSGTEPCGALLYEIVDHSTGSEMALDPLAFPQQDLLSPTKTQNVRTTELSKIGLYDLRLYAYYENSRDRKFSKDF